MRARGRMPPEATPPPKVEAMTGERWMKISDAAAYCSVCENTFRANVLPLLTVRYVPGTNIRRVDRQELNALMEEQNKAPANVARDALTRLGGTG